MLVIGGGITGAGVALDAAARGLRTALVERHDFASGTSSKSSKMVHGGLRYLQQRDFRLVYEALHERQRLLENAPHLVAPLPFLIPLFGRDGVVSKGVARTYATALTSTTSPGACGSASATAASTEAETLAHLPTLRTDRLVAGFLYYDARADDARLTLAVARTAALDHGAVDGQLHRGGEPRHRQLGAVRRRPGASGAARAAPRETAARSRCGRQVVVNATGVWADEVRALDEAAHPHSIRPAKGIHVTVPRTKLPADIAAVIPVPRDRRSIFVVPWPDGDDVYLGTTDTDWEGPLDDPACLPDDVDYVLDAANGVMTEPIGRADVTGGVGRAAPAARPRRRAPRERPHRRPVAPPHRARLGHGVVTVTGGKLTTYRRMAEDTVDVVVKRLGSAAPAGRTGAAPSAWPCTARRASRSCAPRGRRRGLGARRRRPGRAGGRHGGETPAVLDLASGRPELLEALVPGLPICAPKRCGRRATRWR